MKLCKDCHFYDRGVFVMRNHVVELDQRNDGAGICLHPSMRSDYVHDWLARDKSAEPPKDGVHATCDEGRGELQVGEDFGCIHWEKKRVPVYQKMDDLDYAASELLASVLKPFKRLLL